MYQSLPFLELERSQNYKKVNSNNKTILILILYELKKIKTMGAYVRPHQINLKSSYHEYAIEKNEK